MRIWTIGAAPLLLFAHTEAAGSTRGYLREVDFIENDFKGESHRQLGVLEDKQMNSDIKKQVCSDVTQALDVYYKDIELILDNISKNSAGLGLQIETLCKNKPEDPGLRNLASYTRFDYIQKCSQAEQAECEYELGRATIEGKVLLRRLILKDASEFDKIEYKTANPGDVAKVVTEGFAVVQICAPIKPPPYMSKSLPFDPSQLASTCGKAGLGYYVDS